MSSVLAQKILVEPKAISGLAEILDSFAFDSLFIVSGRHSFFQEKIQNIMVPLQKKIETIRFSSFEKNPKIEDLEKGVQEFNKLKNPLVLAIGGGSALDMAKLIYYFGHSRQAPLAFFKEKEKYKIEPCSGALVAIPTTAGTGSESTQFATLYINGVKHSLDTPEILADIALIDSELTESLPAEITAISGMDALTQAVESYWSVRATVESKKLATEAIKLILPHIEVATRLGTFKSRKALAKGSNLAGQAIQMTRTTAAHAISYPMTSFFNVPHGQAVSVSLPYFMGFNSKLDEADVLDSRGVAYVKSTLAELYALLGCLSLEASQEKWIKLMKSLGLKTNLKDLGMVEKDWDLIIQHGFNPDRIKNNPRNITANQLYKLLREFGE